MNLNFTFVLQIISFLILLAALSKLLYKPLMKYLEERTQKTTGLIEGARDAEEKARQHAGEALKALDVAKEEALKLKEESKRSADKERLDVAGRAKEEAQRLIEEAKKQIEKKYKDATKKVALEVGDLSVNIAAKILGREIKKDDHKRLIEESIREIGHG